MSGRPSRDSLTRGTTLGLLSEAMILPTGLVSAAILTRTLGLDLYGLIGVAMAVVSPVAWLLTGIFGFRVTVKAVAEATDPLAAASALLRANLLVGILGATAFAAAAPWIAELSGQPGIVTALRIGALEILLMPVARAHRDALLGTMRYGHAGLAGGVFHLARLATVVLLLLLGVGIETVVGAHAAGRIAEIAWCRRFLAIPLLGGSRRLPTATGRLLVPTILHSVCVRIVDSMDILLLSALGIGTAALGQYAAAAMLAQLPRMVNLVVAPGLIAALSGAARAGDTARAEAIREDCSRLIATASALLLVAAGAAPTILLILFGEDFVAGAGMLRLLLAGGAGMIGFVLISAELVAADRPWLPTLISMPMLGVNTLLLLVLIPRFGAEGAAAATALSYTLAALVALGLTGRHAGRRARLVAAGLAAGAAGGWVAGVLSASGLLVVDAVVGTLVATALLFAAKVLDRQVLSRVEAGLGIGR